MPGQGSDAAASRGSGTRPMSRHTRDRRTGTIATSQWICRCSLRISAQSSTRIASRPALDHQNRIQAEITKWVAFDAPSEGQHPAVVGIPGCDPWTAYDPVVIPSPSLRGCSTILAEVHSLFRSRNVPGLRAVWLIRRTRCRCAVSRVLSNRYGRTWPPTRRTAPYGSACPLARSPSATAPRASSRTGRRTCGRRNRPPRRRRDQRRR